MISVIVDSLAGIIDSKLGRFLPSGERESECGSTGLSVLSVMECSRQNESFADSERSLSKSPLINGRGRTHSDPIEGGRAPKNDYDDIVAISNREGAGGFSKRKRERERAAKADDDGKQKGRWTLRRRR